MDIAIVSRFASLPDGNLAALGHGEGLVRVTHKDRPEPLELKLPSSARSVALSPNGQMVAAGGADGSVLIWNADTGEFRTGFGVDSPVIRLQFSADSRQLASGSAAGDITICDVPAGSGHTVGLASGSAVTSLAFSAATGSVAAGTADGKVTAWPADAPKSAIGLQAHQAPVLSLTFSADGQFLASGGEDGTVGTWHAATGDKIAGYLGEPAAITAIAVSADGRLVATGNELSHVTVWEPETGWAESDVSRPYAGPVARVAFEADHTVTFGMAPVPGWSFNITGDGQATLFRPPWSFTISAVGRVTMSPPVGGKDLMLSSDGKIIGRPVTVAAIGCFEDGRFATSAWDGTVTLWDLKGPQAIAEFTGPGGTAQRVASSPGGDLLAVTGEDNTVRILDARSGACLSTLFFDARVTASFAAGPPLALLVGDRAGQVFEYEIANPPGAADKGTA